IPIRMVSIRRWTIIRWLHRTSLKAAEHDQAQQHIPQASPWCDALPDCMLWSLYEDWTRKHRATKDMEGCSGTTISAGCWSAFVSSFSEWEYLLVLMSAKPSSRSWSFLLWQQA